MSAIIDHRYADRPVIFSCFSFSGGEDFLGIFQGEKLFGFHTGRREWIWNNYKRSHRDARASMRFFANPLAIKMHVQYLPRCVETNVFLHSALQPLQTFRQLRSQIYGPGKISTGGPSSPKS